MSHWYYNDQMVDNLPDNVFGFVYRITMMNDVDIPHRTGVPYRYIGRKYVTKTIRKSVKKKDGTRSVKKKKVSKESDWRFYTGSCDALNRDIENYGNSRKFVFEILAYGYTKGQVNFMEEMIQHRLNVLCDPSYYNDSIGSRRFIGVKFDDQFMSILKEIKL